MEEKLRYYLQYIVAIPPQEVEAMLTLFKNRIVKRNTVLIAEGHTCKEIFFIKSGAVRTYYLTRRGQEKTRYLGFEDSLVTSMSSFIAQQPSTEYVETLEDSELYVISYENFFKLVRTIPAWAQFYAKLLENAYLLQNEKIADLINLTARQRYDKLWAEKPHYFQRISNKILASYLDIRQETLSRLKSK